MSQASRIIKLMTTQGVSDEERRSLSLAEKEAVQDIAMENGYSIARDFLSGRWFFIKTKSDREVEAMHNMWRRGPRQRPHPRSRPRKRVIYKRRW